MKALRRLRAEQSGARHGDPSPFSSFQRVGNRQKRNGRGGASFQGADNAIDQRRAKPTAAPHHGSARSPAWRRRAPPDHARTDSCRVAPPMAGGGRGEAGYGCRVQILLSGANHHLNDRIRKAAERLDGAPQNWLTQKYSVLLGHAAARAFAFSGGNDQNSNARHRAPNSPVLTRLWIIFLTITAKTCEWRIGRSASRLRSPVANSGCTYNRHRNTMPN